MAVEMLAAVLAGARPPSERAVEAEASPGEAGSGPEGRDHRGRRHQPSQLGSQ